MNQTIFVAVFVDADGDSTVLGATHLASNTIRLMQSFVQENYPHIDSTDYSFDGFNVEFMDLDEVDFFVEETTLYYAL